MLKFYFSEYDVLYVMSMISVTTLSTAMSLLPACFCLTRLKLLMKSMCLAQSGILGGFAPIWSRIW